MVPRLLPGHRVNRTGLGHEQAKKVAAVKLQLHNGRTSRYAARHTWILLT